MLTGSLIFALSEQFNLYGSSSLLDAFFADISLQLSYKEESLSFIFDFESELSLNSSLALFFEDFKDSSTSLSARMPTAVGYLFFFLSFLAQPTDSCPLRN